MRTKLRLLSQKNALRLRKPKLKRVEIKTDVPVPEDHSLTASEIRYRRLFETAPDGILILDADTGLIEEANPAMETILGYDNLLGYRQTELVGKFLWEIGLLKDATANQVMIDRLKKNGFVRYDNLTIQAKDGKLKHVELISKTYPALNHQVIQCHLRDISAAKEAEAKAEKGHKELVVSVAESHRHEQELRLIYQMNDLLQSCNTHAEAYKVIQKLGSELFNGQDGCLGILRPIDQYLQIVLTWGDPSFVEAEFELDDCWALRRGHVHVVRDPQTDLLCKHFTQPVQSPYICVPLVVQGETIGLLCITCPDEKWINSQQQLAEIVGDTIKLSLSNLSLREKLLEQALTDQLTGLGNRHYLEDNLSHELARMQRREAPVCLAMLDLDHFKNYNDSYGHEVGDLLLQKFGEVLRDYLRQVDIKCRYGGEEFVIVFIDSSLSEVRQRLEGLREVVNAIEFQHGQERVGGLTVSIGVVEAKECDWTADRLLRAADEALYAAKQAGRDRVAVYPGMD